MIDQLKKLREEINNGLFDGPPPTPKYWLSSQYKKHPDKDIRELIEAMDARVEIIWHETPTASEKEKE